MSEADFWRLTPGEFAALRNRADQIVTERERRAWKRTSQLLAMMATSASGKTWDADDFDPYSREEVTTKPSPQDIVKFVAELNASMGGVDLRKRKQIDA